jgi:hypothetical protein
VGERSREDGSLFGQDESKSVLQALSWLMSFVEGAWVGLWLPVGLDRQGERVWEGWRTPVTSIISGHGYWSAGDDIGTALSLLPKYLELSTDPVWQEALRRAISFFVEANSDLAFEKSMVLAQAGLELLAWAKDRCDKGWASKRIRALLRQVAPEKNSEALIPVPASLPALCALAKARRWEDGPRAVAEVRNGIVHPGKASTTYGPDVSTEAHIEALMLALWYLELGLLRLLGHDRQYLCRVDGLHPRLPPWVEAKS